MLQFKKYLEIIQESNLMNMDERFITGFSSSSWNEKEDAFFAFNKLKDKEERLKKTEIQNALKNLAIQSKIIKKNDNIDNYNNLFQKLYDKYVTQD